MKIKPENRCFADPTKICTCPLSEFKARKSAINKIILETVTFSPDYTNNIASEYVFQRKQLCQATPEKNFLEQLMDLMPFR